jgi:hypothetical protein
MGMIEPFELVLAPSLSLPLSLSLSLSLSRISLSPLSLSQKASQKTSVPEKIVNFFRNDRLRPFLKKLTIFSGTDAF